MQFLEPDMTNAKTQFGNPIDPVRIVPVPYHARYPRRYQRCMQTDNAICSETLFPLIFMSESISTDHESIQDRPISRSLYNYSVSTDPTQIIEYHAGFYPKPFRFFYK
jgi:hypothetical protein